MHKEELVFTEKVRTYREYLMKEFITYREYINKEFTACALEYEINRALADNVYRGS